MLNYFTYLFIIGQLLRLLIAHWSTSSFTYCSLVNFFVYLSIIGELLCLPISHWWTMLTIQIIWSTSDIQLGSRLVGIFLNIHLLNFLKVAILAFNTLHFWFALTFCCYFVVYLLSLTDTLQYFQSQLFTSSLFCGLNISNSGYAESRIYRNIHVGKTK